MDHWWLYSSFFSLSLVTAERDLTEKTKIIDQIEKSQLSDSLALLVDCHWGSLTSVNDKLLSDLTLRSSRVGLAVV